MSTNRNEIPSPSRNEIHHWNTDWKNNPKNKHYVEQERLVRKLFGKMYPNNTDADEMLIKIAILDNFYSTHTKDHVPLPLLTQQFLKIKDLDERLKMGDPTVVKELTIRKNANGETRYIYSFATKYAHHHNQEKYPIYDRYVDAMLWHFKQEDDFFPFYRKHLAIDKDTPPDNYEKVFVEVIKAFRQHYHLEKAPLVEIDKYLWLAGKKYFPKTNEKNDDE